MRQILQLERSIINKKLDLKTKKMMNNFSMEFMRKKTEQDLSEKLMNLERELVEAKMEQQNLRRINQSLENTIKTATRNQPKDSYVNNQRLSMDMTWKEKYELQVQKNLQNQKYIKVLQKKKSTKKTLSLASQSRSKQRHTSSNRNHSNYSTAVKITSNYQYEPNTAKCHRNLTICGDNNNQLRQGITRNSSISKMDSFIDNLLSKDSYRLSQVDLNSWENRCHCLTENKNYNNQKVFSSKKMLDSMDQKFYSVKGAQNDQNAWELIDRKINTKCNLNANDKKPTFLKTQHDKMQRQKLQLSTHYR